MPRETCGRDPLTSLPRRNDRDLDADAHLHERSAAYVLDSRYLATHHSPSKFVCHSPWDRHSYFDLGYANYATADWGDDHGLQSLLRYGAKNLPAGQGGGHCGSVIRQYGVHSYRIVCW